MHRVKIKKYNIFFCLIKKIISQRKEITNTNIVCFVIVHLIIFYIYLEIIAVLCTLIAHKENIRCFIFPLTLLPRFPTILYLIMHIQNKIVILN